MNGAGSILFVHSSPSPKNSSAGEIFFLFGFDCWEDGTFENFFSGEISYFLTSKYLCYPTKVGQEWDKIGISIKKDSGYTA
jgi:hypothetical protein